MLKKCTTTKHTCTIQKNNYTTRKKIDLTIQRFERQEIEEVREQEMAIWELMVLSGMKDHDRHPLNLFCHFLTKLRKKQNKTKEKKDVHY